jgi:pyrroline-5-carboxylate reductase
VTESSTQSARLLVFGGGNMGGALVGGLVASGWAAASDIVVVEPFGPSRQRLVEQIDGIRVVAEPGPTADGVLVAVKPYDVLALGATIAASGASRVLSVAAGVSSADLETAIGRDVAVVRSMPNTPALVGVGAAAIAGGRFANEEDMAWAESILNAVGITVRVPEKLIDAVTGLSGSGPAYVFLIAEAMIEAGVLNGLPRPVSRDLAVQTLLGAATLLQQSGEDPAILRGNVTSPGGTTAAGLRELERSGVRAAILDAVSAATLRSRELGS